MPRILFCRVGWMRNYQGLGSDKIIGGGSYVTETNPGHEIFNFSEFNGYLYGYVQPTGRRNYNVRKINLERLGGRRNDKFIEDVLVVWFAKPGKKKPQVIVGWYENAIVYRCWQPPDAEAGRVYNNKDLGYYMKTRVENGCLLPIDKRVFKVRTGKGLPGQSNTWYADSEKSKSFISEVLGFIKTRRIPSKTIEKLKKHKRSRQPDVEKRKKVEEAAVREVIRYYQKELKYNVDRVDSLNLGWDLEASLGRQVLYVEVKGLSGGEIAVELTPNEYESMVKHRLNYRVAVVTDALSHPKLSVFSHNPESGKWEDDNGVIARVEEVKTISARLTV